LPTGGVFIGPRDAGVVAGSQRTAIRGDVPHEMWDAPQIRDRLPAFCVGDDMQAIYEPGACALAATEARLQMLNEAARGSATVWYGDPVEALESGRDAVIVRTRSGQSIHAGAVVITIGPWTGLRLLPELRTHLVPNRVPIYLFAPRAGFLEQFDHVNFPVFLYECHDRSLLYGIGAGAGVERGVKIGFHNRQHVASTPDGSAPPVGEPQRREIARYVAQIFPVLLHDEQRRVLPDRGIRAGPAGGLCICLLGPWLQIRDRDRRSAGIPRAAQATARLVVRISGRALRAL
jgi:sarcosine oxidase